MVRVKTNTRLLEIIVRSRVTVFTHASTSQVNILLIANPFAHVGTQKCTGICQMVDAEKSLKIKGIEQGFIAPCKQEYFSISAVLARYLYRKK